MHKVIVIGRGLIGSAAGRHLAGLTDGVALLGPDEPADRATHRGVFASHYDEGRMTRAVDPDPIWAVTAKRSIDRYDEIEAEGGIRFFTPSGYLGLSGPGSDYLDRSEAAGRPLGAQIARLDAADIRTRFPFLKIADDRRGLHETGKAGHLSPRAMVAAQSAAAAKRGATIIAEEAAAIRLISGGVEVETAAGAVHQAERVLIAAGAFTDAWGLSPQALNLRVFGRTVTLARIEGDLAEELASMPTMGHAESGAYILPPIRYPDGHLYLKIGIGSTDDADLHSREDFSRWFKSSGSADNRRDFQAFLTDLIPGLARASHWHTDTCAVAWTATGYPHIDWVEDGRIAVAVGGNGKGAKSADDWGWLAARLVAGEDWDHPVSRDKLRLPAKA
ncbi:FAD-binding oxidoreductase [Thalassobaculum sp. OXR-137]|uniref:NAD(P)/FAD-dependent oxidoreductase n=1 Tax=Thalassobaculum sp. OXR-137 TaxID=3100173 RepID=UPI002AC9498D|nr:FAD-binding oxidoreductase [Thalassobaculum sp. OXR-137]WPZ33909.1 FAD-binding oxidoreductase [Thalassobaculum sp. OXR-137]